MAEVITGTQANPAYGMYWWLKRPVSPALAQSIRQIQRHIMDIIEADWIPDDFVMAAGAYEQRLYVIPSKELVVARNGPTTAGGRFKDTAFLSRLLRGIIVT
jgi:hypothetical protein